MKDREESVRAYDGAVDLICGGRQIGGALRALSSFMSFAAFMAFMSPRRVSRSAVRTF